MIAFLITLSRLISSVFVFYCFKNSFKLASFLLIFYAFFSDFADGVAARKFNEISKTGAMFDVIADKAVLYAGITALIFHDYKILFLTLNWILKDIFHIMIFLFGQNFFKSLLIGKIYTLLQYIVIILFVFLCLYNIPVNLNLFIAINLIFGILGLYSFASYYKFFNLK